MPPEPLNTSSEPRTFEEAVSRFEAFLRSLGHPTSLVWVEPSDLLLSDRGQIYVKLPVPAANSALACDRFRAGMDSGLGVLFGAVCEIGHAVACHAWVPKDSRGQECNLMGSGLKLKCPTDWYRRKGQGVTFQFY
jgi:hypothetical protein